MSKCRWWSCDDSLCSCSADGLLERCRLRGGISHSSISVVGVSIMLDRASRFCAYHSSLSATMLSKMLDHLLGAGVSGLTIARLECAVDELEMQLRRLGSKTATARGELAMSCSVDLATESDSTSRGPLGLTSLSFWQPISRRLFLR